MPISRLAPYSQCTARSRQRGIRLVLLLCCPALVVFSADTPPSFQNLTQARLQAAAKEARNNWNEGVSPDVVAVAPTGMRNDAARWYQLEVQWCKQAHCSADDFSIKNQSNLAVVVYSISVTAESETKLFRCTDTYVNSGGTWRIVSAFQTSVPNARRTRAKVDQATLQTYVGTFSNEASEKFEIVLIDGRLYARKAGGGTPTELIPESPMRFYVIGDDSITTFTKSDSGEVTGVKITGSNGTTTLTKVQ